ncbi:MerR family transcriptional regulator [Arthrobacter jiangjiafuii]|uniref:MerR family transcriptional regulator n=1 Tax=Arthrobacter jiangjiafuii TaxID=2817475 RepID=A0A975M488_9MICC|nr:MerR family transcriptional regulator [Arthrobacter jiangjiafuii]MBP3042592.1 MerR family transcriptional regulator [Arthrobacter jiangjiafuii]QWC09676.1 MerR family transcriptional regulator [Arthrobacter jiangjiafuii]
MLSIGAFAQIGQVTHRMLRHWDTSGLLVPAHVDEFSGYRSYDPSQLERLHRIVALRHLGFGLEDIAAMLESGVDAQRLALMLRIRRAEVEDEQRTATVRLIDVERRLHLIEKEKAMPQIEIVQKSLPALRLVALSAVVSEQPEVPGVVGPLFDSVARALKSTGAPMDTPVAQYEMGEDGMRIVAGYACSGQLPDGVEAINLPPVPTAVCGVHLGTMEHIAESWQAVHAEIFARGLVPSGPCRELYVRAVSDDQADWVTELQQPVAPA